ncbi:GspE/PulE family protein [Patescibacteria group bacterium]
MKEGQIRDILIRGNYITERDFVQAEEFAEKQNLSAEEYLLSSGIITKDLLGQAMAEHFGVIYADLNSNYPNYTQVSKIPEEIARKKRVVLFKEEEDTVIVATDKPDQRDLVGVLKMVFSDKKITISYSLTEDIDEVLVYYKEPLEVRFERIAKDSSKVIPDIINEIFDDAIIYQASDIHLEPQEDEVVIRFRIDGVLREVGRISNDFYENILNRIKVLSHLRIDEHFSAQDGAIRYLKKSDEEKYMGVSVDMRVSIAPTLDGEKVTIRLLSQYMKSFTLFDLGLSEANQKIIQQSARKPFGMILVTGPTGSGKTTSLYAILKMINSTDVNVTTIEDPVEYKIQGVNQIQVNPQTNLTFSKGLRSIIRQDPDVILVGEIRDEETAEIAVNAALTGHLLLSTFHANDAATSIPRFLDMGVEPFLLASTLEVIVAQRLVRKLCENCRFSSSYSMKDMNKIIPGAKKYFSGTKVTLYKAKGCSACGNSGYKGRTALFEIINVSDKMQELILKNPSTNEIWKIAKKDGSLSLFEDGIDKVKRGITSLEEVLRVSVPPE